MPLSDAGRDDCARWLRFALTPGIGAAAMRELLAAFGLPEDILAAGRDSVARVLGAQLAEALTGRDPARDELTGRTLGWAQAPDHHLVTMIDAHYPARLLQIGDPPPLLFVRGDPARLSLPALAIVGSRSATRGGLETATAFATALGDSGRVIVSGLAAGIDAAAHRGALRTAGGTVAVMGTGVDRAYPPEHAALADAIVAAGGAVVSELPLGTEPRKSNFPSRNRLIAGLSEGVLVVEAALRSGSLITARMAGEFGREVFAVPGSIHSPLTKGCHQLIKQGAKLVESAQDVLGELPAGPARTTAAAGDTRAACATAASGQTRTGASRHDPSACPDVLLEALGADCLDPDQLARRLDSGTPISAGELAARLMALELDGTLERRLDGRFVRARH